MFSLSFLINLVLLVFLALVLNYIQFNLYVIILKKKKLADEKIILFKKTYKGNFISFLTIGLSVLTILYTQPTSYTVHISKSLAMFGPFTICIIGFIILLANTLFNIKLIKKLIYLKLD